MQLVSKISNLCDPDPPRLQTDGQTDRRTTCSLNTALCTSASRGKNHIKPCIGRDYADVDECSLNISGCGSEPCFNNEGSYTCDCPAGFIRDGTKCVGKSCYIYTQCACLSTPRFQFLRVYNAHIKEYLLEMPKNVIVGQITDIYNLQLISLHANLGYLLFLSCHWQSQSAQKSSHC